jgi:exosortase/archaeosortase family protein
MGVLAVVAGFIWVRDLTWLRAPGDTMPIVAALPLFVWLKGPWVFSSHSWRMAPRALLCAALLIPAGVLLDSNFVLTAGWTALLWSWISGRSAEGGGSCARRLLVLPFLAFPWIATDFERVGWWFRLSGAAVTQHLLAWCQLGVVRHGTYLSVNDVSVTVDPACSGINGLQSMLIAGAVLAYVKLKETRWYWYNLPVLVLAAWAANVLRILSATLCVAAWNDANVLRWLGPVHLLAGWLALCAMFAVCWWLFSIEERWAAKRQALPAARTARWPWLEILLLSYCAWRSDNLVGAWFHNPFDRLGWVAFLIWLLPVAVSIFTADVTRANANGSRLGLMGIGLGLTFLGDLGDLNFSRQLGLAMLLMSFASRSCAVLWCVSAVAWLPAAGWLGSRFGVTPEVFGPLRVGVAVLGSIWAWQRFRWENPGSNLDGVFRTQATS